MLLILGFAESSNDSESIFRSRDGEAPGRKRCVLWRWGVEGEETDGRGHPNTQVPRLLWCLASRYDYSRRPWHTGRLEGFLKAQVH